MSKLQYTPVEDIPKIHSELRAGYDSGKLKSIAYRKYVVLQLGYLVKDNAKQFEEALLSDLGRPAHESQFLEIGATISEAKQTYENVDKWAKPDKPAFNMNFSPMRRVVYKEPKGVVLVISPFNYPIWLSLGPLISAIAAGNTVVLKPSEQTPAVSSLFAELLPKYVDTSLVRVVNGAVAETTKLMELPWGHVLFTGSGRVARIIASAAGKTLSPVTLELGGKSPVFIDSTCDETALRRMWWGKFANAGQTCVAPDYILVPRDYQDKLADSLKALNQDFFPDATSLTTPGNYTRLVTPQAFARVSKLLKDSKGQVVFGGETDEATKFIAPTLVKDVKFDDSLMSEEIFGPVLPIVPIDDLQEGIDYVKAHDHPLSVYVFSRDARFKEKVFSSTESGSAIANESIIHPGVDGLPFGGIGPSGGGGYHTGKFGFDLFTHQRSSLDSPSWVDKILSFRYPPYTESKSKAMRRVVSMGLPARPSGPPTSTTTTTGVSKWWLYILVAACAVALTKRLKSAKGLIQ